MNMLVMLLLWRAWLLVAALFIINPIAVLIFKPSWKSLKRLLRAIPFALIWPLAIFSSNGRKILFNQINNLKDGK